MNIKEYKFIPLAPINPSVVFILYLKVQKYYENFFLYTNYNYQKIFRLCNPMV
jgi:hypothetical protein